MQETLADTLQQAIDTIRVVDTVRLVDTVRVSEGNAGSVQWVVVLTVAIAVVGWVVTHRLTLKAQDRHLKNQILNEARNDLIEAIRTSQQWLGQLKSGLTELESGSNQEQQGILRQPWAERYERLANLLHSHRDTSAWHYAIEANEILFPQFSRVTKNLTVRERRLTAELGSLLAKVLSTLYGTGSAAIESRKRIAEEDIGPLEDAAWDLESLLEDLRVHVQNFSLSEITGNKVPIRVPQDPSAPLMELDSKEKLRIRVGDSYEPTPEPPGWQPLAETEKPSSLTDESWKGVEVNGRFFAWEGYRLATLDEKQPSGAPPELLGELEKIGIEKRYHAKRKLSGALAKGWVQIYETDSESWRREMLYPNDGEQVLMVRPAIDEK